MVVLLQAPHKHAQKNTQTIIYIVPLPFVTELAVKLPDYCHICAVVVTFYFLFY